MKKYFFILFIFIQVFIFSFNIIIDDITIEASEVNFSVVKKILETYSSFLNDEKINFGSLGSFSYIEWHDKLVAFSNEVVVLNDSAQQNIFIDDVLDFFEINYFKDDNGTYYLATMVINDLKDFGSYFQIDYLGKNSISTIIDNDNFYIISLKYVYFNEKIYLPNEVIFTKKIQNTIDIAFNDLPNRIIIQLIQTYKISNIKFYSFSEKVIGYDPNTLVVIFNNSESNLIFVRNYSPDFNGNDWQRFSLSTSIAKKISSKFNFKIYYIPFIQLPLDAPGIVIFTSNDNWEEIKKFIEGEIK